MYRDFKKYAKNVVNAVNDAVEGTMLLTSVPIPVVGMP